MSCKELFRRKGNQQNFFFLFRNLELSYAPVNKHCKLLRSSRRTPKKIIVNFINAEIFNYFFPCKYNILLYIMNHMDTPRSSL